MATATPLYSGPNTVTITINGLASDTNLLLGRSSLAVSNVTDDAVDVLVGGKFVLNAGASTTGKQIEVWAYSTHDDGTTWSGSVTGMGTDASAQQTAVKKALLRWVMTCPTDGTAANVHAWGPVSLSQVFGGVMPRKWGLWVVQNTAQPLGAAGNEIKYDILKYESA